jgi:predicted transposase/invertase (TIGR01784 family)
MVFGDEKNTDILAAFLKTVLDIPEEDYEEIKICDPIFKVEVADDKMGILDVKVKTKSGKIIDVEMQVAHQGFMKERILYYISKMISEQLGKGEEYNKIQKVVSIIIAAEHKLVEKSENFRHKFLLTDKNTGIVLTDKIEVDTLEIMKIPEEAKDNKLVIWLDFMKAKTEEELNMLATQRQATTELLKAVEIVRDLNADEYTKKIAERREKFWRDYKSSITEAIMKGEARGETNKAREIAKSLLSEGLYINFVSKHSKLSIEEVKKIKEEREIALKSLSEGLEPSLISKLANLSIEEIETLKSEM